MTGNTIISVIGDVFIDILAGPLESLPHWGQDCSCARPIEMQPGGSALNTATHLASIYHKKDDAIVHDEDKRVLLHSAIGKDEFGTVVKGHLERSRVEFHGKELENCSTGTCMVLTGKQDRSFITYYGSSRFFKTSDLRMEDILQSNHVHLAGFYNCQGLLDGILDLLKEIKGRGITISLDTNYDSSEKWDGLNEIFPLLDVFLPNEVEAMKICRKSSPEEALEYFSKEKHIPLTVITLGDKGAIAMSANGISKWSHAAFPVEILDPTGAGDAFNAGFLYGWKYNNNSAVNDENVEMGLRYGSALASKIVASVGACMNTSSLSEINRVLENCSHRCTKTTDN